MPKGQGVVDANVLYAQLFWLRLVRLKNQHYYFEGDKIPHSVSLEREHTLCVKHIPFPVRNEQPRTMRLAAASY